MAKTRASSSLPLVFLFMLILSFNPGGVLKVVNGDQKSWCVAKPSTDSKSLQKTIDFVCHEIHCSILNYGSPCYEPNNLINHASIVMNLYYQRNGRNTWNCVFEGIGLIVLNDPSYGSCMYE